MNLTENMIDDTDINLLINTLTSGKLTMGRNVKNFEECFSNKFNFKYSVMVNSGSSANLLAMSVLCNPKRKKHFNKGDSVLVPSVCWSTSVFPIVQMGLKPIFMDVNPNTLNINAEDIYKYKNIKGIVLVHILGNSTNMNKVMEIVKEKDLIVLEDTCESMSCIFDDKYLGGFGDMGTFSMYYSHHITTIEGGIITCKTKEDYDLLLCMRSHGWIRNLDNVIDYENKYNVDNRFCFINYGYNLRPMEIQGTIGINQLKKLDNKNKIRDNNYKNITNAIINDYRNYNIFSLPSKTELCKPYWLSIVLFLSNKYIDNKKEYLEYLTKNNIDNRPIVTGNFTRQPVIDLIDPNIDPTKFVGAEIIHNNGFYIGCPSNYEYSMDKINKIVDILYGYEKFKLNIPFFDYPYNIDKSIPYVNDVLKSTWISNIGKYIDLCTNKLKLLVNCKYIILTSSGTASIHCMVKCLKYRYPDCNKIYIPNNTYIACINVLLQEYNEDFIECLDVDENTLNIENVEHLEKGSALFIVHNANSITNIPKIKRNRPDLIIFEDNAEGFTGYYENMKTGSESICSSLSFNMNKNITAGQGGAFCTNDVDLYNYINKYTKHGKTDIPFIHDTIGMNYLITNLHAAVLYSQLEQIDDIMNYKKHNYNLYNKYLNNDNIIIQKNTDNTISSYWKMLIRIKNLNIDEVIKKLNDKHIEIRRIFYPFQSFDYLSKIKFNNNSNAYQISNEYIFLPFDNVSENNIKYICDTLNQL